MSGKIKKYASLLLGGCMLLTMMSACSPTDGVNSDSIGGTQNDVQDDAQSDSILNGKTILWLGSSVTYGSATNGVSMAEYLQEQTGCVSLKYAVSGTTLVDNGANSYVQRLMAIDGTVACDYFICQLSTNDAAQGKPLGEVSDSYDLNSFDTTTVCGAIEFIIAYAKQRWNCPIAFYTNPPYASAPYQEMVSALLEIQKKWDISVLDMRNDPELVAMSISELSELYSKYMADSVHPNATGYEQWWTPVFREFIESTIQEP